MVGCRVVADNAGLPGTDRIVVHTIMRRQQCIFALVTTLACGLATMACAEVQIEGNPAEVRVTTSKDTISDVLSAFGATFNVQYRTAIPLDASALATYSGSLGQVISRLLDGYNYVIKTNRDATEVVVYGRSGEVSVPPKAISVKAQPVKDVLSRWR
jgi:hypothetical protein